MVTALIALGLSTALDFDHAGAPVGRVVAAMGEAYGAECRADATMDRDYVILALRGESFERARSLLAKALNATWTEKDGRWTLHRTREQEREDERRERDWTLHALAEGRTDAALPDRLTGDKAEEFVRDLSQQVALGQFQGFYFGEEKKLPGARAAQRLLDLFTGERLVRFAHGARVPFNLDGSRGFERLPNGAREVLEEFVKDQNNLVSLWNARAATIPPPSPVRRVSEDLQAYVLLLDVQPYGFGGCQLIVPDSRVSLFPFRASVASDWVARIPDHEWPLGVEEPYVLTEAAEERIALRPVHEMNIDVVRDPSKRLLQTYLQPESHDAWELAPSEIVRQAADSTRVSLVVATTDILVSRDVRLPRGPKTLRYALDTLFEKHLMQQILDREDVILRPRQPVSARAGRVGRVELARAINDLRTKSPTTLESLAELAATSYPYQGLWTTTLSGLSGAVIWPSGGSREGMLVLYAELSAGQRRQAESGGVVLEFARLGLKSKMALREFVCTKLEQDYSHYFDRFPHDAEAYNSRLDSIQRLQLDDLGVRLKVASMETLYLRGAQAGSHIPVQPTSVAVVAGWKAAAEHYGQSDGEPEAFKVVRERGIVIELLSATGTVVLDAYFAPSIYAGDEFLDFEQLPSRFQSEFSREYEAAKKRLAATTGGGTGR